jgi:Peptidase family M48
VIYNMLYENESFGEVIQRWANVNGYISFFMRIAVRIIQGIQWLLRKTYGIVNKNYMGLSREMEFHADEVAANFAGSAPMISSLLRLDLANYSYNAVINHYNEKIHESVRSEDVYSGQQFVMQLEGRKSKLDFSYGLPMINKSYLNKFNKSRLVVEDQWSSHPSTIDRVNRLESLNISPKGSDQRIAAEILRDRQKWQRDLTNLLFAPVTYSATPVNEAPEDFEAKYSMDQNTRAFPEVYLGYYDGRNPIIADINNRMLTPVQANDISFDDLFNENIMDIIYTAHSMERDIISLKQIHLSADIKTFDYDGQKYPSSDGPVVAEYVAEELGRLKKILHEHDEKIMQYFIQVASRTGKGDEFSIIYKNYSEYDTEFDRKYAAYINLVNDSSFMHETTPYDEIDRQLEKMKESEQEFRIHVKELLSIPGYSNFMTQEQKQQFESFVSGELVYFTRPEYNDEALKLLFDCINNYYQVVSERYYFLKNELLKFQEMLLASEQTGSSRHISAA